MAMDTKSEEGFAARVRSRRDWTPEKKGIMAGCGRHQSTPGGGGGVCDCKWCGSVAVKRRMFGLGPAQRAFQTSQEGAAEVAGRSLSRAPGGWRRVQRLSFCRFAMKRAEASSAEAWMR
jgi:hypothetical protein